MDGGQITAVHLGPPLDIELDVNKELVHHRSAGGTPGTFMRHAPVTGGIVAGEDRMTGGSRCGGEVLSFHSIGVGGVILVLQANGDRQALRFSPSGPER
jgi:hypothetical protein